MEARRDKKGLTEEEFLRQYRSDKYPKPSLTADILVFRRLADTVDLLLIRRKGHPFLGYLALPGGFAEQGETLEQTASRELEEETGITDCRLNLIGIYSKPGRDPRGWTVSAAYAAVVEAEEVKAISGDDAASVEWVSLQKEGPCGIYDLALHEPLAFDHEEIIRDAIRQVLNIK